MGVLIAVLTGVFGGTSSAAIPAVAPPPVRAAATPVVRVAVSESAVGGAKGSRRPPIGSNAEGLRAGRDNRSGHHMHARASVARISSANQLLTGSPLLDQTETEIPSRWMEPFYPIYGVAQSTFGVNWLLIASIHKQESAFSTNPTTYHGLNFAGCCGGPMQFNVTNGPITTWDAVRSAYRYGKRPAVYDHRTATHPSIYDDFDSIMAAAWLLSSDGASLELDDSAWTAAYDYYGHDTAGVEYADEVIARAIGWSQHGFCINCGVEATAVQAVYEAYGAPLMAAYIPPRSRRVRTNIRAGQRRHQRRLPR